MLAELHSSSITMIRRTGWLPPPSMPEISSTLLARPPQPTWRMSLTMSRISVSRCGGYVSESMRSLPQRSHLICMSHDGNALNASVRACWPVANG
jgi:hypothetical protein